MSALCSTRSCAWLWRAGCVCSAGIRASPSRDLPDQVTILVLFALLDTGVSSVRIHRAFSPWSSSASGVHVGGDERDEPVLTQHHRRCAPSCQRNIDYLSWPMPLGIALAVFVLGRVWGMNNGCVDDGAPAQRQNFFLQVTVGDREDCRQH